MIDLSAVAGFPLRFDPATLAIEAGPGFRFREKRRTVAEMSDVLEEPRAGEPAAEVYRTYLPEAFPEPAAGALAANCLTYSLVAVRPLRLGREAAKTYGHLHPVLPGTTLTSPEVYAQLHGRLVVMLQLHDATDPELVREFVAIELAAGEAMLIPPGWAHGLANPFDEPGLLAGLYADPGRFPASYELMERCGGMAYRVRPAGDGFLLEPNPACRAVPATRLARAAGTPFEAEPGWLPLWSAAAGEPRAFRFMAFGDEAVARFGPSGGARS
jgi:oxalate decarboxylase/phosphoglucose isomerase-like protein (cupin superfamily)